MIGELTPHADRDRKRGSTMVLDQACNALRAAAPIIGGLIDANPDLDLDAWRGALPVEGLF